MLFLAFLLHRFLTAFLSLLSCRTTIDHLPSFLHKDEDVLDTFHRPLRVSYTRNTFSRVAPVKGLCHSLTLSLSKQSECLVSSHAQCFIIRRRHRGLHTTSHIASHHFLVIQHYHTHTQGSHDGCPEAYAQSAGLRIPSITSSTNLASALRAPAVVV